jgi:hypothetical protein
LHALIDEKEPIDANALIDIVIDATKGLVTEAELRVAIDALMYEPCNTIELSTEEVQEEEEEEEEAEGSNYQVSIRYRSCVLAALRLEGHLGTMGWSDF